MADLFLHRRLRHFCATVVGIVFFASGSLKMMDPVGTGLIVEEYLSFFHMDFLTSASTWIGPMIALAETFIGLLMMFGVWRKFTSYLVSIVVLFFTIITAILLVFNPEMDCGCFGEALHLSHFQSFIKNIVLCALVAVAVFPLDSTGTPKKRKYVGFGLAAIAALAFFTYSQIGLPLIDFTEFNPGTELLAAQDEYEFLGDDEVVSENENISVLSISDAFGEYQDGLLAQGEVMAVSVYAPEKMSQKAWGQVSAVLQNAQYEGMLPVLLSSSMDYIPIELSDLVYFADYKTLITFNRSNGGATYLFDGRIIRKWSWRGLPDADGISSILSMEPVEAMMADSAHKRLTFQGYLLYTLLVMMIL